MSTFIARVLFGGRLDQLRRNGLSIGSTRSPARDCDSVARNATAAWYVVLPPGVSSKLSKGGSGTMADSGRVLSAPGAPQAAVARAAVAKTTRNFRVMNKRVVSGFAKLGVAGAIVNVAIKLRL